jgi:hypothetical protein
MGLAINLLFFYRQQLFHKSSQKQTHNRFEPKAMIWNNDDNAIL